jgi:hypothetical protein
MDTGTVLVAIVGILASGIVGPMLTARATRQSNKQQFELTRGDDRRKDLRDVADEAARLLALGATNLRLLRTARERIEPESPELQTWASSIHILEQRLLLRVASADPVATTYHAVRRALLELDQPKGQPLEDGIAHFEAAREDFLGAVRASIEAPVDTE